MGTWGYKVFEDDTSYDALYCLKELPSIIQGMKKYFDDAINADYIWYDEGCYALVCAAVIDNIISNFPYECDCDWYSEWIKSLKNINVSSLKPIAVKAIAAVLSDKSELKKGWKENKELYDSWLKDKLLMQERLND